MDSNIIRNEGQLLGQSSTSRRSSLEPDSREKKFLNRRTNIAIGIIAVLVASGVGSFYALAYFQICVSSRQVSFTILMTDQGFNGSRVHTDPWPVLNVERCDKVTFHVVNQGTEDHGFAITHYLDSGVKVRPGQTDDVTFGANRSGTFLVYCDILCTIHIYMQNGRLNVT